MAASPTEIEAFVTRAPASLQLDDVGDRLGAIWMEAQRAWPALGVPAPTFFAYLAERLTPESSLAEVHATDLYLACACVERRPAAIDAFEAQPFREAALVLGRMNAPADRVEDAKQNARRRLLADGALADYAGRGGLVAWLRVLLTRELVDLLRGERAHARLDTGELARAVGGALDPETEYLRTLYQGEFKRAFAEALKTLGARERRLLRYGYVERLGVDDVGALLGVHRATAARQIARARQTLLERTRQRLEARLRVSGAELQSILRLIESQVDVSLQRLLR